MNLFANGFGTVGRLHLGQSMVGATVVAGLFFAAAPADEEWFRAQVAPILQAKCLSCHDGPIPKGGLSLASARTFAQGGESGPVVVPGKPNESLLWEQVRGPEPAMPKDAPALSAAEQGALRQWIERGAHWPANQPLHPEAAGNATWSFEPIRKPRLPAVQSEWIRSPIDAFILAMLHEHRLAPTPAADARTLLRRVQFDLTGLPPTAAELDAFELDKDPLAFERRVDSILASPAYGERWGRHWLDVVHYGDTHGYDKDKRRPNAWPYRDYVIRSFNADKPYGRFIIEQLAGDHDRSAEGRIATGFIAAGPWDFVGHVELAEGTVAKMATRALDRDDMVTNALSTFCSVTVHCARCHDHPFDPIRQEDYYRLQAVFSGVERAEVPLAADSKKGMVFAVRSVTPRPIAVLHRGEVTQPLRAVSAGALPSARGLSAEFALSASANEGERRLALARWIADPANPLTWRSIVNRVWHYHFGRGLVETPSDFGKMGTAPSHPELLDWLAADFRDHGGSIKRLHRQIVTSSTYRQASTWDAAKAQVDGGNRFLWRSPRRRLEAEVIHDTVLAASGQLDRTMGGPPFDRFAFQDDHSPRYEYDRFDVNDSRGRRRAVYRTLVRSVPDPLFECLDAADPSLAVPARDETMTALQALALWNNPFILRQSEHLAQRARLDSTTEREALCVATRRVLGRSPTSGELEQFMQYSQRHGLAAACRLLLNSSELMFVD